MAGSTASEGIKEANRPELALRIWPASGDSSNMASRMAFYGPCFRSAGAQGPAFSDFESSEAQLADDLARAWLGNALNSTRTRDAGNARLELGALEESGQAQGTGAAFGRAIAALDHIPWLSHAALSVAGRVNTALAQVTSYLSDPALTSATVP